MSISNTSMSLPMHSFLVKAGACPLLLVSLVTVLKKPIDYTHFKNFSPLGLFLFLFFFRLWSCSRDLHKKQQREPVSREGMQSAHFSHSQQRLHCLLSPVPSLSLPPHHQLHQQLSPLAGLRFLHFLYQVWEVQNHQQLLPLSPGSQAPTVKLKEREGSLVAT